jgi:hypothetical protein
MGGIDYIKIDKLIKYNGKIFTLFSKPRSL